jgi:S-adenosylmethionine:tRNA ribosyltransferase-isomerase
MLTVDDFDFDLPEHLIAQRPSAIRGHSRLMNAMHEIPKIQPFYEVPSLFKGGEVLVLNNTKVVPARLFAQKSTGGAVEVFFLKLLQCVKPNLSTTHPDGLTPPYVDISAMTKGKLKEGMDIILPLGQKATFIQRDEFGSAILRLAGLDTDLFWEWLQQAGKIPLPPYINRDADQNDQERYQTVFAKQEGAVAAPTAGLHFTQEILDQLRQKGVQIAEITLHVGAGTFLPIKENQIQNHKMHSEAVFIPEQTKRLLALAEKENRPIIAVGTTVVRALESYARNPDLDQTEIFIQPGFEFKLVDGLFTNFHLPKSTLLILLSALIGKQKVFDIYQAAIEAEMKFYSYGDSSVFCRPNGRWQSWI